MLQQFSELLAVIFGYNTLNVNCIGVVVMSSCCFCHETLRCPLRLIMDEVDVSSNEK